MGIAGTISNILQKGGAGGGGGTAPSTATVVSTSPSFCTVGTPNVVQVHGTGFKAGAVIHGGATAVPTTFVSATQVDTTAPGWTPATTGNVPVGVANPGEVVSNTVNIMVA